mgnify:CR=1 FL=1
MSRVALVTGGTRGIGEAISLRLKEEGYKVAASYVSRDEDAQKFMKKTGVRIYKFDVAIFDQCSDHNFPQFSKTTIPQNLPMDAQRTNVSAVVQQ